MLKRLTSEFIVFALILTAILSPVSAQTDVRSDEELKSPANTQKAAPAKLKEDLASEVKRSSSETASFDPAKADVIYQKQAQQPPKKWSTTKKVLVITAIAVAVAAVLFVAIKYAKDCARTEPANCDWVNDEYCRCVEYVPRNP